MRGPKNHSDETKAKISAKAKGREPWNKGKSLSQEIRVKISASLNKPDKLEKIITRTRMMQERLKEKEMEMFLELQRLKSEGEDIISDTLVGVL